MNFEDMKRNAGITGKIGETAVAVYKSADDLYVFENTCPHLRCELTWNDADSVWDCPCHNSRFSPMGDVLNGPARAPLKALAHEVRDGLVELV